MFARLFVFLEKQYEFINLLVLYVSILAWYSKKKYCIDISNTKSSKIHPNVIIIKLPYQKNNFNIIIRYVLSHTCPK